MGSSALRLDNIPVITRVSGIAIAMAPTNAGKPTRITVGGQQYTPAGTITLATSTTGANGLDSGTSIGFGSTFYVYAIVNQSTLVVALIASLSSAAPAMPSGYGTAFKLIGGFQANSITANSIDAVYGLYSNLPGTNSPGNGYDATLGWFFGGPTGGNNSQSLVSFAAAQMTGGQNLLNFHGSYSPGLLGQYSGGRTIFCNNVESISLAGESYAKKATTYGSSAIVMGLSNTDNDLAFRFLYSPAAVSSPQASLAAMWSTTLATTDALGQWTIGPPTTAQLDIIQTLNGRLVTHGIDANSIVGSEGLYSITTGGVASSPTTLVQATLGSIAGSTHAVSVQLYVTITVAGGTTCGTYVVTAQLYANGGASASVIGTPTLLAGGSGTPSAPTFSWSGAGTDATRSLQIVVQQNQGTSIKIVAARRGAGSSIAIS